MHVPFTKMHGLGNDFVMLDLISNPIELTTEHIQLLGNRRLGVGCDQVLVIEPPSDPSVDFKYRIFNQDGREVEHCGNGARCFATFVREKGLTTKNVIKVETVNRILELHCSEDGLVSVDMGAPDFTPSALPFVADQRSNLYTRQISIAGQNQTVEFAALSVGNPHAVLIVEDLDKTAVTEIGEALGAHPDFPEGVNVGFMQILSADEIRLRVFERGAGETLACGTGACAAVVAGCLLERLSASVKVNLRGGELRIEWPGEEQAIVMTGPTTTVYEGIIEL
jgi:diaminopimelate epimerase